MTDAEAIARSFTIGIFTILILGVAGKIIYDWFVEGRAKKGEYYMTVASCESCREKCCVHGIKEIVNQHMRSESYHDSEVNTRLANIEKRMEEARDDNSKLRDDVGGIKSALDKMTAVIEIYVKRADERDTRINYEGK
jgi:hypothetical protein